MENLNLTTCEILTFIPAGPHYDKAIQFYEEMGFVVDWRSEALAVLKNGKCRFFLQNIPNGWTQDNFMMTLVVENLDHWWTKLSVLQLDKKYDGVKLRAPEMYPWGKREIHLIDTCGVLWHICEPDKK